MEKNINDLEFIKNVILKEDQLSFKTISKMLLNISLMINRHFTNVNHNKWPVSKNGNENQKNSVGDRLQKYNTFRDLRGNSNNLPGITRQTFRQSMLGLI